MSPNHKNTPPDFPIPPPISDHKVARRTRKRVETLETDAALLERIDALALIPEVRTLQKWAFEALARELRKGKKDGIIKLPTGTGKTRVFAMMLRAFEKNGLILVPRTDLYDSTARELCSAGFSDADIRFPHEELGSNSEDRMMSLLTDPDIDWKSGKTQCIMTYQALTAMARKNPEMGGFLQSHFDIIIEDEAHRGLGDQTKDATDQLKDAKMSYLDEDTLEPDTEEQIEIGAEHEAESILALISKRSRYAYKFTATPDLLGKSVSEDGEYLYYATVEDAVRTGAIVLPQYVDMGSAYTKWADLETWKTADIEKLAEGDNFVDESGRSIREKIIASYREKKTENGGKLPAVAFASTIAHAAQIVEVMRDKGIRAERVTSGAGDISSAEAVARIEANTLDVIVTVTKVSEGFDYPPLACAMWFTPSLSPAKILQGNGRIMRVTDTKKPDAITDSEGKLSASPNTYIIAPSVWYGGSNASSKGDGDAIWGGDEDTPTWDDGDDIIMDDEPRKKKLPRIGNFYELLISQGELDINSLSGNVRGVIDMSASIVCEVGEEVAIDGVVYVGITQSSNIMGMKGFTILNNLKKDDTVKRIDGRQKNGMNITLVSVDFIKQIKLRQEWWEEIINWIAYIRIVRHKKDIQWHNGATLIENAKKAWVIHIVKKWSRTIHYIPKKFIDDLDQVCNAWDEKLIDGITYVRVTRKWCVIHGIEGQILLNHAKKQDSNLIRLIKQGKWHTAQFLPKFFIEGLLNTCNPWEEKIIDGDVYVGVTSLSEIMELKGFTIRKNAKKAGVRIIPGKQKNWKSIQLVPKSFIEALAARKKS